jgi:hypothetical protein
MKKEEIHIGELICKKLEEEGRTKKWLAKQVNCDASSFCKALKKNYIDTIILLRISLSLDYDFFRYYSDYIIDNKKDMPQ